MLKIKEWWNEFKKDLIFNLIMTGLSSVLLMFTLLMIIISFKRMIGIC